MREYLFPIEKVTSYFGSINSKKDLQKFIQQRSAHVTQTTLYGYLKTRIGVKFTAMVEDDVFSKSINIAKWNIYMVAIADCAFYAYSYLMVEKDLKENDCKEIYLENPFKESCLALYNWAPIADELKTLDKEIVLNSMRLKWNLKIDEFKKLTRNLKFN